MLMAPLSSSRCPRDRERSPAKHETTSAMNGREIDRLLLVIVSILYYIYNIYNPGVSIAANLKNNEM